MAIKYTCTTKDGFTGFNIKEYDTKNGVRKLGKAVIIHHNSIIVNALYDSVEDAIKSLGSSRKNTTLPDGSNVIPEYVNFPYMKNYDVLKPYY